MTQRPSARTEAMADVLAARLADRAAALAAEFFEGGRRELALMAAGDGQLLYRAAQLLRSRAAEQAARPAGSPEHLAFSLLVAAHELLRSGEPIKQPDASGGPRRAARRGRPSVRPA